MVHVAKEMERRGFELPLLIGGATTSRQHTAVKIAPQYAQPVVHVLDASRAVGVVSTLLDRRSAARRSTRTNRESQEQLAGRPRAASKEKPLLPIAQARASAGRRSTAAGGRRRCPSFLGRRELDDVPLDELVPYIDWTFFFSAWELKGKLPGDPRRTRSTARRRASSTRTRTALLDRHHRREAG